MLAWTAGTATFWAGVLALAANGQVSPLVTPVPSGGAGGLGDGGRFSDAQGVCVPESVRARVRADADRTRAELGLDGGLGGAGIPGPAGVPLYSFYPAGGVLNRDLIPPAFVDVDPGPGWIDYACNPYTREGHAGIDTGIRNFEYQVIGVPVFAVADGVVVFASDGQSDMNTECLGAGNIVAIDHGGGRESSYFHLKSGSVSVGVGDTVVAGEQIGMIASSGCSFGPHLHFESRDNFDVFEPFAGACRAGPSGWVEQPALVEDNFLIDFGVTTTDLDTVPGLPFAMPTDAQIPLSAQGVYFWLLTANLPEMATWRVRFISPLGGEVFDSGDVGFFNDALWRDAWFWWYYEIPEMRYTPGTWRIVVSFSGQEMIDAPVEVVEVVDPGFNRPPAEVALSLDPASPQSEGVIRVIVDSSLVLDDPDWDIVRYRYEWFVDGVLVRDATFAAMSDVLARGVAPGGSEVCVRVTPSDGRLAATPTTICAIVEGSCPADLDDDGDVDGSDFFAYLDLFVAGDARADIEGDGDLDAGDFFGYLDLFVRGCS